LAKLNKEDKVTVPKSLIALTTPALPDTQRGLVLLSMDILLQEDADADPVGEAQNEPNKDPKLITPIAGRGLGDALAGAGLGISLEGFSLWNLFGPMGIVIAIGVVLGAILTFTVLIKSVS
jgi:hypothetical protein